MTLTENSFVVTNDTQEPQKYPHTGNSCSMDALPCATMTLKLPQYFYLLMEKPLGCYFQVWSLPTTKLHSATRKHLFLYAQGDRSGLRKPKKGQASALITATTSIHLPKPVSFDLTIKTDSVLTNPIGKDQPHKTFLSWRQH